MAELVGRDMLRTEIGIDLCHERTRQRNGGGGRKRRGEPVDVVLGARRRAGGARDRGPDRLVLGRVPEEARARLRFPAGVGIALDLRAERQAGLVRREGDLVLHERADEGRRRGRRGIVVPHAVRQVVGRGAIGDARDDLVADDRVERELGVEVGSGVPLGGGDAARVAVLDRRLHRERAVPERGLVPLQRQVRAARQFRILVGLIIRRDQRRLVRRAVDPDLAVLRDDRQAAAARTVPVDAGAGQARIPALRAGAGCRAERIIFLIFRIDAGGEGGRYVPALAHLDRVVEVVAGADRNVGADGGVGVFRDEVDDTVDGVGAPQRAGGSALDLDAAHVAEDGFLERPDRAGKQLVIDRAAVHENEQLVRGRVVEAADRDGVVGAVGARHLHARDETQHLRQRHGAAAVDLVVVDDVGRRRRVEDGGIFPAERGHFHLHKLFEA